MVQKNAFWQEAADQITLETGVKREGKDFIFVRQNV